MSAITGLGGAGVAIGGALGGIAGVLSGATGVVVVSSLFGATGAGLAAWKMDRRPSFAKCSLQVQPKTGGRSALVTRTGVPIVSYHSIISTHYVHCTEDGRAPWRSEVICTQTRRWR